MNILAVVFSVVFSLTGTHHTPTHHGHKGCKHITMLDPRGHPEGKVWMCPPVRGIR